MFVPWLVALAAPLLQDDPQGGGPGETIVRAPRSDAPASATAGSVQVVTGAELERTGARSLPQALGLAAGVWIQETNLGGGAPFLRGLVGNQILIVVDGVRLNDATTRGGPNQSLNGLDPHAIERVEIVRGPASVLYGSDALGGAILIWTRRRAPVPESAIDPAERFGVEVDGTWRSAADGARGALTVTGAGESLGGLVQVGGQNWNDLRAGDGETQEFTGYHGNSFFSSVEGALGEDVTLRASALVTRDFDVPRTDRLTTGFGQSQPSDSEHHFTLQARERWVVSLDDVNPLLGDTFQARFSFRHYQEDLRRRGNGSTTRRFESFDVDTLGVGLDWRKALGDDHLLTFGLDADWDQVDSSRLDVDTGTGVGTPGQGAFAPDSRYVSSGLFVRDEIFAFEPFLVTAGVRYSYFDFAFDDFGTGSRVDGNFDAVTASLQVTRPVAEGVRVSATLSQGFRAPNLADLAKNGSTFGGTELANPDLDPEQSLLGELAVEWLRPLWSASLAVYHNGISDTIGSRLVSDPTPGVPGDETYMRDNVGRLAIAGVEARLRHRLGGKEAPWYGTLAAELVDGRQYDDVVDPGTGQKTFNDVPLRREPPLHGAVGLRYQPDAAASALGWAELSWVWAARQDDLNPGDLGDPRIDPNGTDGWSVLNLDLGGPIGPLGEGSSWSLGLHNLLDERYRVHGSGFDAAGFGVLAGLHISR